jgi:hypothetical protein
MTVVVLPVQAVTVTVSAAAATGETARIALMPTLYLAGGDYLKGDYLKVVAPA